VDTCLAACSVAIVDGERTLAALSEPMVRGHQERLGTLVREAVEAAGVKFSDLNRIGVTVGPGSFTGLRVGLAFAKGLGEFGATITFVTNLPGETRTLPIAIYTLLQIPGGEEGAIRLTVIAIVLSIAALLVSEILARRSYRRVHGLDA